MLPSFNPPLGPEAGLLSALNPGHKLSLIYPVQKEDQQKDREKAGEICCKVRPLNLPFLSLERIAMSQSGEEVLPGEFIEDELPDYILDFNSRFYPLAGLFSEKYQIPLFSFKEGYLEGGGRRIFLGPGIDPAFFQRKTSINTASQKIFFIVPSFEARDELIYREALRLLRDEVWPLVRGRHPYASLTLYLEGDSGEKLGQFAHEPAWDIKYGKINPEIYETGRLSLAPFLWNSPANLQPALEAWAMQIPLIVLPGAARRLETLGARLGSHFLKGEDGPSLATLVNRLMEIKGPGIHLAEAGRKLAEQRCSWTARAAQLEQILEGWTTSR